LRNRVGKHAVKTLCRMDQTKLTEGREGALLNYYHYQHYPREVMPSLFRRKEFHDGNMFSQNTRDYMLNIEDSVYRQHTGKLIVFVYEKNTERPIQGAKVSINQKTGNGEIITTVQTNESGQTTVIVLPAPPKEYALQPTGPKPYADYIVTVEAAGYGSVMIRGVQIFEGTTAKQKVELTLGNHLPIEIIDIPEHKLTERYLNQQLQLHNPYAHHINPLYHNYRILEFIIVHNGHLHVQLPKYMVRFTDYIKNVASCELYPSWPEETLRTSILCMISFTLNRLYINNSHYHDHSYAHGKHTFAETDNIIDEIFNQY